MVADATYNAGANVIRYWVCCQAADNAGALATSGSTDMDGATRPGTTADSTWTQTSVTGGTRYTVSITGAVQEVVDRAGWASGNAIVVLVDTHADTTLGEWQDYRAFNHASGGSSGGPHLDIDYGASDQTLALPGIAPRGDEGAVVITPTPPQIARPSSDVADGGWTNEAGNQTNLYASIDEVAADDADFIQSDPTLASDPVDVGLESLIDPLASDGHIVRYRYLRPAG